MSVRVGRTALSTLLVALTLAALALTAQRASAAVVQADCSQLQADLTGASSGDTIELTGICTGGSFTLPSISGLTVEGAPGQTDGFDGTGASGSALSGSTAGLTLRDLTFENYSLTQNAAVHLTQNSGALPTIASDRFLNNSDGGSYAQPAALNIQDYGPESCSSSFSGTLSITGSTFQDNTANASGGIATGGAVGIFFFCDASDTASLAITGNTFSANKIVSAGVDAYGAGLYIGNGYNGALSAQQSNNVFTDNSIVSTTSPAASSYNGAGEWLASVNLASIGDEFVGNSLPGPSGASASSWGAGLGVVRSACGAPTAPVTATATDLVAIDNTIGAPSNGGAIWGAGIYAGCTATVGSGGFHLTLINSTVTANTAPDGAAGVSGESTDVLNLQNTIVQGNTAPGASDLGGFGIGGGSGSVTATYSDVCAVGSTSEPFAGTGNICADPKLADAAGGDVHETAASPTIDAGSNALLPAGVTTDFYGQPRIVGTHQSAGNVDIGAAEWQTAYVAPSPTPTPTPAPPTAALSSPASGGTYVQGQEVQTSFSCTEGSGGPGLASCDDSNGTATATGGTGRLSTAVPGAYTYTVTATSKDGQTAHASIAYTVVARPSVKIETTSASTSFGMAHIVVGCTGGVPGTVCRGTITLTTVERVTRIVHHRRKVVLVTVKLGRAAYRLSGGRHEIIVRLTRAGARLLAAAHGHRLRVRVSLKLAGGKTVMRTITLRLIVRRSHHGSRRRH